MRRPQNANRELGARLLKKEWSQSKIVAQPGVEPAIPVQMKSSSLDILMELEGTAYAHVRPLASGGMGEVHVVRHLELREDRVMKVVRVLDPDLAETIAKRTLSEGRLLRPLRHPHIVELLDLGRTRTGRPFLVTELLHGRTLREEVLSRTTLPWQEVVEVLLHTLAGLGLAHEQGLVHRDVKPLNLFYTGTHGSPGRAIKILDFGIAKALSRDAVDRAGSAYVATREGFFLGTPAFLPPEQAVGGTVDARSDLYAVAAVGFYLLTGQLLFRALSHEKMVLAHLQEAPPSARRWQPSVPERLDALLLKALAKMPSDRFADAAEMSAALRALREAETAKESPRARARPANTVRLAIGWSPPSDITDEPTVPNAPSPEQDTILDATGFRPELRPLALGAVELGARVSSPRRSRPRPSPRERSGSNGRAPRLRLVLKVVLVILSLLAVVLAAKLLAGG